MTPTEIMARAMEAKRLELINQPLARIWPELSDAAKLALEQAGWCVVPREATARMLDAAGAQFLEGIGEYHDGAKSTRPFSRFYRAMISAARAGEG